MVVREKDIERMREKAKARESEERRLRFDTLSEMAAVRKVAAVGAEEERTRGRRWWICGACAVFLGVCAVVAWFAFANRGMEGEDAPKVAAASAEPAENSESSEEAPSTSAVSPPPSPPVARVVVPASPRSKPPEPAARSRGTRGFTGNLDDLPPEVRAEVLGR